MFGNILGTILDVVNIPVKVANAGLDIVTGGDGSKASRREIPLAGDVEEVIEEIAADLKDD